MAKSLLRILPGTWDPNPDIPGWQPQQTPRSPQHVVTPQRNQQRFTIDLTDFLSIVGSIGNPPNQEQASAIQHPVNEILQVVAGPGSGKTTVLLLRALRLVFVDDILPENILITTFTKKAARDIRSRWLDLGTSLLNAVARDHDTDHIDLNRCQTGTLDSITQQVLVVRNLCNDGLIGTGPFSGHTGLMETIAEQSGIPPIISRMLVY